MTGMLDVLADRTYRTLFAAQVIALAGTGLLTVALALLAFEIAGPQAGIVLGTVLAIKMVAYVGVAPIAGAFADRLPRRSLLVAMDLVRAAIAAALPFVDQVWQVYLLIFLLQSASAAFTPTFQATIPDVLPDERRYTRALSLSRLAYDLESLLSPTLAAALLLAVGFHWLFAGTAVGFLASAALVLSVALPRPDAAIQRTGIYDRTAAGLRIYLATPRLRGLLALNLAAAAAGAFVIVDTVVLIRGSFGMSEGAVAVTTAFFGGGSMVAALVLPRILDRFSDRRTMLAAGMLIGIVLLTVVALLQGALRDSDGGASAWPAVLAAWAVLGLGYSALQTPTGRLLRRSAHAGDRPALFAAQFALSHACWLITYPLAGWLGPAAGLPATAAILGGMTLAGIIAAAMLWPAEDPDVLTHAHPDLPEGHAHLTDADGSRTHAHPFVIDDLHRRWPA